MKVPVLPAIVFWIGLCSVCTVQAQDPSTADVSHIKVEHTITQGLLIKKVKPVYPKAARQQRIEGTVVLRAIIDEKGKIKQLSVVSGDPLLSAAALKAVKQWRYKPYYLGGKVVEVDTTINVNFTLKSES